MASATVSSTVWNYDDEVTFTFIPNSNGSIYAGFIVNYDATTDTGTISALVNEKGKMLHSSYATTSGITKTLVCNYETLKTFDNITTITFFIAQGNSPQNTLTQNMNQCGLNTIDIIWDKPPLWDLLKDLDTFKSILTTNLESLGIFTEDAKGLKTLTSRINEEYIFADKGVNGQKNNEWFIREADASELTVKTQASGTTLTSSSTTSSRYYFANPESSTANSPPITMTDFTIEADIVSTSFDSGSQIAFLVQGLTNAFNLSSYTAPYHLKMVKEGTTVKQYVDDELIRTTTIVDRTNYFAGFQLYKSCSIKYKNYRIIVAKNYTDVDIAPTNSIAKNVIELRKAMVERLLDMGKTANNNMGLTTLAKKNNTIFYNPDLDGSEPTQNIIESDYDFTTNNGYAGGYHQVGYLSDGFDNHADWELTMTLQTSSWDGGFTLLLEPYPVQTCNEGGKWDCIFKNNQSDILQWIDGKIKINSGSSLSNTGISYKRNTTMDVKITKSGTTLSYYENNTLKGTYTWAKLATAPRVYLGVFTWGGSGSVNQFSNVVVK